MGTQIRHSEVGVSPEIEHPYGKLRVEELNKTAPVDAETSNIRGLDAAKERRVNHRTYPRSEDRVSITREYLNLAQKDLDTARRTRLHYAHLGRAHGMTYGEIAECLGVTEAAARMLIQRNPEAD
jgi:hypothetical protein